MSITSALNYVNETRGELAKNRVALIEQMLDYDKRGYNIHATALKIADVALDEEYIMLAKTVLIEAQDIEVDDLGHWAIDKLTSLNAKASTLNYSFKIYDALTS